VGPAVAVGGRIIVTGTYKLLPPDGHLAIPTRSRDAARAGLTLYTACKRSSLVAQRTAWHLVGLFGPRVLPGRTDAWRPPVAPDVWRDHVTAWRSALGDFDDVALHLRRPAYRAGASLLLLDAGRPVAFVKLRPDEPERLDSERRALDALRDSSLSFTTPAVLSSGTLHGWHHLALSPLPVTVHTMIADPPLDRIVEDIGSALSSTLPRPQWAGAGWLPMHGDLTPWNLRALTRDRIVLFDWESATWAPRRADLLWYDAVRDIKQLSVRHSGVTHDDDVVVFWIDRLAGVVQPGERSLAATVLRRLRASWRP
jgi:hypothetical protein